VTSAKAFLSEDESEREEELVERTDETLRLWGVRIIDELADEVLEFSVPWLFCVDPEWLLGVLLMEGMRDDADKADALVGAPLTVPAVGGVLADTTRRHLELFS